MELIREIIVPTSNSYTLTLPDKLIGKKVEVMLAFETDSKPDLTHEEKMKRLNESLANLKIDLSKIKSDGKVAEIQEIFKDNLVDMSNFKFDRDEANNYDE